MISIDAPYLYLHSRTYLYERIRNQRKSNVTNFFHLATS